MRPPLPAAAPRLGYQNVPAHSLGCVYDELPSLATAA